MLLSVFRLLIFLTIFFCLCCSFLCLESPQLSSPLSVDDHVQDHEDLGPDYYSQVSAEPLDRDGERPVSLVSTLSSGSSRDSQSLFGSTVALPSSTTPPISCEEDIDLELSPAEGDKKQAGGQSPILAGFRSRWREQLEVDVIKNQWNNNNATSSRKASSRLPHISASPVVTDAMAPDPKLTYVDRVVMEIIETERMYVRDLRSIVKVSVRVFMSRPVYFSTPKLSLSPNSL